MLERKKNWFPDSLVLIFLIIVAAQVLTYLVPTGAYDRIPVPDHEGREMVDAGTFHYVDRDAAPALSPWYFLEAVPKGLAEGQEIIFLVFLVGGVIAVLRKTGAIDAALYKAVVKSGSRDWILIAS